MQSCTVQVDVPVQEITYITSLKLFVKHHFNLNYITHSFLHAINKYTKKTIKNKFKSLIFFIKLDTWPNSSESQQHSWTSQKLEKKKKGVLRLHSMSFFDKILKNMNIEKSLYIEWKIKGRGSYILRLFKSWRRNVSDVNDRQ